jgi:hypothetical protein
MTARMADHWISTSLLCPGLTFGKPVDIPEWSL